MRAQTLRSDEVNLVMVSIMLRSPLLPKKDPREDKEGPRGGPKKKKNKKKKKRKLSALGPQKHRVPQKRTNPKGHLVRDTQRQKATTTGSPVEHFTNPKGEPGPDTRKKKERGDGKKAGGEGFPTTPFDIRPAPPAPPQEGGSKKEGPKGSSMYARGDLS